LYDVRGAPAEGILFPSRNSYASREVTSTGVLYGSSDTDTSSSVWTNMYEVLNEEIAGVAVELARELTTTPGAPTDNETIILFCRDLYMIFT
jgi:hypothetical protein